MFLRFHVAVRKGEEIEKPRGWLFRTAHNLALNAIDRRNTRRLFALDPEICASVPAKAPNSN